MTGIDTFIWALLVAYLFARRRLHIAKVKRRTR